MRMRHVTPLPLLTTVCVAAAAVASASALAVQGAGSAVRLGLLPSPHYGALACVLSAAIVAAVPSWALPPLLLSALVLLPWLPLPVPPVFLAWAGPLEWWAWGASAAGLGAVALARVRRRPAWLTTPRSASLVAGFAAALLFAATWTLSKVPPSGDEPHYLLIAQSLLRDGDIQVDNNYASRDYLAYYPGELRTHIGEPGRRGRAYSVHAPGVAALVAPAFAIAGYRGVVAFLVVLSAAGTVLVWRTGYVLTRSAGAAWFGWATVTLSAPVVFQGSAVYPDPVAGAIIAAVLLQIARRDWRSASNQDLGSPRAWTTGSLVAVGTLSAALPWLHTRFVVLTAILLLGLAWLAWRAPRRQRHLAALFTPAVLVLASWVAFFWGAYGTPNPSAPYGARAPLDFAGAPRGLLALLVDQEFGILPNAPALGVALAGIGSLFRLRPRVGAIVLAIAAPYLVTVSSYSMWWGGASSPARFAVPVLFALGAPAAAHWSRASAAGRATSATLLGLTAMITLTLAVGGDRRLAYNFGSGSAVWLEWIAPLVDLPAGFPSAFRTGPPSLAVSAGTWAVIAAVGLVLARAVDVRLGVSPIQRVLLAPLSVAGAVSVGLTIAWAQAGISPVRAVRAQLALVRAAHDGALDLAVALDPPRVLTRRAMLSQLSIPASLLAPAEQVTGSADLFELVGVPAATYELDVQGRRGEAREMSLVVGNSTTPLARWTLSGEQASRARVTFPINVTVLRLVIDRKSPLGAAAESTRVFLRPVDVPTEPLATQLAARAAARYGQVTVFATDERVSLEGTGLWVLGGRRPTLALAPDSPRAGLPLIVRNGPVDNEVRLISGPWHTTLTMAPGVEEEVVVPTTPGGGATLVTIEVARGFRPADVDPTSRDKRFLGCWIEVRASVRGPAEAGPHD